MLRILVVDDDRATINAVRANLARFGWTVLGARSVREAMALMNGPGVGAMIDVLLTDYRMPAASGLDLVRWARKRFPRLAAVLMTGYGTGHLKSQALEAGCHCVLDKPFRSDLLASAIREAAKDSNRPTEPHRGEHARVD